MSSTQSNLLSTQVFFSSLLYVHMLILHFNLQQDLLDLIASRDNIIYIADMNKALSMSTIVVIWASAPFESPLYDNNIHNIPCSIKITIQCCNYLANVSFGGCVCIHRVLCCHCREIEWVHISTFFHKPSVIVIVCHHCSSTSALRLPYSKSPLTPFCIVLFHTDTNNTNIWIK